MDEPRPKAGEADAYPWHVIDSLSLSAPTSDHNADFFEVLKSRTSEPPEKPLSLQALADLLWFAASYRAVGVDGRGRRRILRAAPSAGGVHPIEVIIECSDGTPARYEPLRHALKVLALHSKERWDAYCLEVRQTLASGNGTIITLLGDIIATGARYEYPESLLLRDAGAFAMTLQMTSRALGYRSVALGIRGRSALYALGLPEDRFVPCGAFCVGSVE